MPRRTVLFALAALPACRMATPASSAASAATAASHHPDTAAIIRDLPRMLAVSDVPGLAIAVVDGGRVVWARGFGTRNDSAQSPVGTATIFEAASLSKPVMAYLALRLADRGALDLDRPLADLVDYPRITDPRARRITARTVLSHGTGLPNWGGERLTLAFEPGSDYGYSGEGFLYLQRALERMTGESLDALARREVFQPLGMTRSGYVWRPGFEGDVAWAKDWVWRVAPANRYADANAAASLLTTAPDYARFVAAVLVGRGLRPETWKAYLAPVHETAPGIAMALGVRVERGAAGPIFYHSGNNGRRFTCYMSGDVARGVGMVYFTNTYNGTSLMAALASRVYGEAPRHRDDFDRYDDPRLVAIRSVKRAAVERGADAARARLAAISADSATRPSFANVLELGGFFAGRRLIPLALELLQRAAADSARSGEAQLALGRALEAAGRLEPALASYRRALTLGADSGEAEGLIHWAEERVAARARPVRVGQETMARYPGRYLERRVTLRRGRLFYSSGAYPESPLAPMTERLFEVEADPTARVRFEGDGSGPAPAITVLYSDGTIDEAPRTE
jgi:CubicO group peptidase (beta-lactamase class C family)